MGVPVAVKHTKGSVSMVGADDRWGQGIGSLQKNSFGEQRASLLS